MTFLSIIVPFKKGERYLKDCLDSLAEQNLEEYEVILILNAVEEDLSELLDEFKEKLNLVTKSFDEELTASKARNEGLNLSSGKYVYFIDSDDYVYKDGLAKLIAVAKQTDADFINGERIETPFIRERFDEELEKKKSQPLEKGNLSDAEYSIKLLVADKTNKQEVLSILHALIKRELIGDFRFDEEKIYLSDYDLFNECIGNIETFVGVEDALYAKRDTDDPINLPSITQRQGKDKFYIHLDEYKKTRSVLDKLIKSNDVSETQKKNYKLLKDEMANSYFQFYYNSFAPRFNNGQKRYRKVYYKGMQSISKDFKTDNLSFMQKQEVKALQNNKIRKLKLLLKRRFGVKKIKKTFKSKDDFYQFLYKRFYNKKDVNKNQIMFISFGGKFYSDSPRSIYEYLYNNHNDEFDFVWVIDDKKTKIPGNPKKVERFSKEYYKEVAKSKYWVTNGRHAIRLKKKKDQVLVSTWHGTPLKKLGFDIGNVYGKNPNQKKLYRRVSKEWDYLISPSAFVSEKLRSSFGYDGVILEEGYPRNDKLYNATESEINEIRESLKIPKDKKVVLYAPTWRDDKFFEDGSIEFKLEMDLDKLKETLSDEYVLLVKTHYFVGNRLDLSDYEGFVYNVSTYDDIVDLYLISDILVTDYSSVFFDFANLKRPMLFYTYDLDKYENVLRGFYIDIHKDVPGPLVFTTDELADKIANIDKVEEEYKDKYDEFYNTFCYIDDGDSSKRVVEKIWKK